NHVYTFEALLIAADAYKRAGSSDPKALADAIRATNITDNVSIGPGIQFNAKGQNDTLKNGTIQNRAGKLVTLAPKDAANAKPSLSKPGLSPGGNRRLPECRGCRNIDGPRLWPHGAWPFSHLRCRARRQFRPWRNDVDRDVSHDRVVLGPASRSAGHA